MATQVQINVGRRKESVARVRLVPGTGNVTINGRPMDEYFGRETSKMILIEPLKLVDQLGKVDVLVTAHGGRMVLAETPGWPVAFEARLPGACP
jgi:small subunit ribosomal protein S9